MTAPQPATPGSDSVHAQIAEELRGQHARTNSMGHLTQSSAEFLADFLVPLVDSLRAEAKAEALEEAASVAGYYAIAYGPFVPVWVLRDRAAAYRTNPSKETDR